MFQMNEDTFMGNNADIFIFIPFSMGIVALLFYVHGKHLRSCRDGQLT